MRVRRVVSSAAGAWIAAALGGWLAFTACRSIQRQGPVGDPGAPGAIAEPTVPAPSLRVGVLVDVARVSIGADSGLSLRLRLASESGVAVVALQRATFRAAATPGRLQLVETGQEVERALLAPAVAEQLLQADATTYRGLLEVRPGTGMTATVVNVVNLEDYLRGVVPNELSPQAFPEIEALKAQAVAARTYALAHLGEYSSRGFDVCATPACQVYKGQSSEHPLTDRAVAETAAVIATWRGRAIHAYYTSTCGGHTEDGGAIFDDDEPYLRGVDCEPEGSSRQPIRGRAAFSKEVLAAPGAVRDVALLFALGVLDAEELKSARLTGIPHDSELRGWMERLKTALHRSGCSSGIGGSLARRGNFAQFLVSSLCWQERAERLLAPGDPAYLLQAEDASEIEGGEERRALALLVHEGLVSPHADNTLRPGAALTRLEVLGLLAGAALKVGPPALREGELVSVAEGELRVLHGEQAEAHAIDESVSLIRDLEGVHSSARELTLSIGDRVVYVLRDERVAYLEVEQSRRGMAADRSSRYYNWEVRLTPAEVEKAIARYGNVGRVRDLVPRRLGVSGRVVELAVAGSAGELLLKGLKVRWGLGLRENLFVIDREVGGAGVERFVITGKGWGHGVGLCQVGAFGMAQAGSSYEAILRHYYSGIGLSRAAN